MRRIAVVCLLATSLGYAQQAGTAAGGAGPGPGGPGRSRGGPRQAQVEYKPEDLCTVEGVVRHAQTGEALRKVSVTLFPQGGGPGQSPSVTSTDAEGKFAMKGIEPGRYQLIADKPGFVRAGMQAGGSTVTLARAQKLSSLDMKLMPQAVITGRVLDEDGEPVQRVQVQMARFRFMNGRRQLMPVGMAQTDDRGEYRIFGLAAGRYVLSATGGHNMGAFGIDRSANKPEPESAIPTYYPSADSPATASTITVPVGGNLQGMDMRLLKARTYRIRGVVSGFPEGERGGGPVMLQSRDESSGSFMERMGGGGGFWRAPNGEFEMRSVRPGSYYLRAESFDGGKRLSAIVPIEVGSRDLEGVRLTLQPGGTASGFVKIAGETTAKLTEVNVYLQTRPMSLGMIGPGGDNRVKEDGSFEMQNLLPVAYTVSAMSSNQELYLKSVMLAGQDVTDTGLDLSGTPSVKGLEIVMSAGAGKVDGTVNNEKGEATAGVIVGLKPVVGGERASRLFKTTTSDQSGAFHLSGIAPGEYLLAAFDKLDPSMVQDPDLWEQHAANAVKIVIKEGATENKTLKAVTPGEAFLQ